MHSKFLDASKEKKTQVLDQIEKVKTKVSQLQQNYTELYDNEQRLDSLKISNQHVLKKKSELEQDSSELESAVNDLEKQLVGLKSSVKSILKNNCHLETKLNFIKLEIQEYQLAFDELEFGKKKLFAEENDLQSQLQKLKNDVSVTRTEYFKTSKALEALKLQREALIAKISIHNKEISALNNEIQKEQAILQAKIDEYELKVKNENQNRQLQMVENDDLKVELGTKIEEIALIEIDSYEFQKQKNIYENIILTIEEKIVHLQNHEGSLEEIRAQFSQKELEYWNMLNLNHVLDNSKMMNILTNSPSRQAFNDEKPKNQFSKYQEMTLNIPEVSEHHEESNSEKSVNTPTKMSSKSENQESEQLQLLVEKNLKIPRKSRNSSSSAEVVRVDFCDQHNLPLQTSNSSNNLNISLNQSYQNIVDMANSLEHLHVKIDDLLAEKLNTQPSLSHNIFTEGVSPEEKISISPIRMGSTSQNSQETRFLKLENSLKSVIETEINKLKVLLENKNQIGGDKEGDKKETKLADVQIQNHKEEDTKPAKEQMKHILKEFIDLKSFIDMNMNEMKSTLDIKLSEHLSSKGGEQQQSFDINSPKATQIARRSTDFSYQNRRVENKKVNRHVFRSSKKVENSSSDDSTNEFNGQIEARSEMSISKKLESLLKMTQLLLENANEESTNLQSIFEQQGNYLDCLVAIKDQTSKNEEKITAQNSNFVRVMNILLELKQSTSIESIQGKYESSNHTQSQANANTQQVSPPSGYQSTKKSQFDENMRKDVNLILTKLDQILSNGTHYQPPLDESRTQSNVIALPEFHQKTLQKLSDFTKTIESNFSSQKLNQNAMLQTLASEMNNNKFFNLTHMIFKISSQMVNCLADFIQDNQNYRALRKEIIK